MEQDFKFHSSSRFCFECGCWKDRNENGFGTCMNPSSAFNGNEVPAMNKCTPSDISPGAMDYEVVRVEGYGKPERTPQPSYEEARCMVKSLMADELEALAVDGKNALVEQVQSTDGRLLGFYISPVKEGDFKAVSIGVHKRSLIDRIKEQVMEDSQP